MYTNISEKLDLFQRGLITDDQEIIGYDTNLHKDCYQILDNYWSSKLQYIVETFITEEDLIASSGTTDVFPISGDDFSLAPIYNDVDDIQDIVGIDFQSDLGITGTYYDTLTGNISAFTSGLFMDMAGILSGVSGIVVGSQDLLNQEISGFEANEYFSKGMIQLIKLINGYLESNDVAVEYNKYIQISLDAMGLWLAPMDISIILDDIYNTSKVTFAHKLERIAHYDNTLYSKLDDNTVEDIVSQHIKELANTSCSESIRIAKATNSLMPSDEEIYNNTSQLELFETTESLIKQIDVFRDIAIEKGYMDYEQPDC